MTVLLVYTRRAKELRVAHDTDHWSAHDTYAEAEKAYEELLLDNDNDVYSASICAVLRSTDFDAIDLPKELT
jgi:hypothetical protein